MKIAILALSVGAFITSCNPKSTDTKEQKAQPYNVLFIAIDDLNDWTGFAGGHAITFQLNCIYMPGEDRDLIPGLGEDIELEAGRTALFTGQWT